MADLKTHCEYCLQELGEEFRLYRGQPVCNRCWKRKRKRRKIYNVEWRKKNLHKIKAHSVIAKALRKGELNKPKEC
jgi:hypothetical protein